MLRVPFARLIVAALALHPVVSHAEPRAEPRAEPLAEPRAEPPAEPIDLDLAGALARARRLAPDAITARDRIAESEARARGADVPFTSNPELEGGAGPRLTAGRAAGRAADRAAGRAAGRAIDVEARLEQTLELGRRGARRELAHAEIDQARASAEAALRELDLEVALAFVEVVYAEGSAELARRGAELAQRAAEVAARRRRAGDLTDLDVNLARAALGRARAASQASAAQRASAVGRLAELIGARAGDAIRVRGDLRSLGMAGDRAGQGGAGRADVRVLDAARAVAVAEHADAVARARPDVGVWIAYQREDRDDIVLAGLRLSLPVWNRAPGETTAARVRERSAIETRASTLRKADRQVVDATAAYQAVREAVEGLERDVLPVLDDSEQLLQQTVDAGQLAMSDYLVARQELASGRREYLDRLLALARAATTLRYVTAGAS